MERLSLLAQDPRPLEEKQVGAAVQWVLLGGGCCWKPLGAAGQWMLAALLLPAAVSSLCWVLTAPLTSQEEKPS